MEKQRLWVNQERERERMCVREMKNLCGQAFDSFFCTRRATLTDSSFFIPIIRLRTRYARKHLSLLFLMIPWFLPAQQIQNS